MDRNERSAYTALGMESDPFRNGIDACCMVHTSAGNSKFTKMGCFLTSWSRINRE